MFNLTGIIARITAVTARTKRVSHLFMRVSSRMVSSLLPHAVFGIKHDGVSNNGQLESALPEEKPLTFDGRIPGASCGENPLKAVTQRRASVPEVFATIRTWDQRSGRETSLHGSARAVAR